MTHVNSSLLATYIDANLPGNKLGIPTIFTFPSNVFTGTAIDRYQVSVERRTPWLWGEHTYVVKFQGRPECIFQANEVIEYMSWYKSPDECANKIITMLTNAKYANKSGPLNKISNANVVRSYMGLDPICDNSRVDK